MILRLLAIPSVLHNYPKRVFALVPNGMKIVKDFLWEVNMSRAVFIYGGL
jgi:hypothetical protein